MTDKEVIVDGKKETAKVLFECYHIDDSKAFDMIRKGIKITPENAPIGDFEIKLIENVDSPFGFSSICKRSSKEDVWEYMGFGHSGACSIVIALLKQLRRKEQECEELLKSLRDSEQRALIRYTSNYLQCVLPSNCIAVNSYKQAFEIINERLSRLKLRIDLRNPCSECNAYTPEEILHHTRESICEIQKIIAKVNKGIRK